MSRQVLIDQVSAQTVFGAASARARHAHAGRRGAAARRARPQRERLRDAAPPLPAEHGAMRRIDLAERLRLTPSGVTRLLDGLEEAGLTGRRDCPSDARVTYSVITDAGREMLRLASCTHAAVCEELIGSHLSPAELEELSGLLGRLPGGDDVRRTRLLRRLTPATRSPRRQRQPSPRRREPLRELARLRRREIPERRANVRSEPARPARRGCASSPPAAGIARPPPGAPRARPRPPAVGSRTTAATRSGKADASADTAPIAPPSIPR